MWLKGVLVLAGLSLAKEGVNQHNLIINQFVAPSFLFFGCFFTLLCYCPRAILYTSPMPLGFCFFNKILVTIKKREITLVNFWLCCLDLDF